MNQLYLSNLERRRHVQILIDRERHAIIQIMDQLISACAYSSHGVVHRDFMMRL